VTDTTRKGRSQALKAQMELRDLVLAGNLAAGERVFEVPLSERLGISRTPLREALGRLEQEGLLERLAAGGYAVRTFSFDDVTDAIELRGVLEGMVARLAAERGADPVALTHLDAIVTELDDVVEAGAEAMDFAAYTELNAAFHATLATLAGSETIRREVARAAALPFASPSAFLDAQAALPGFRRSLIVAQAQHREIAGAIAAREGARAEAIAREHARLARRNLEYVMTEDRSLMDRVPGLALVAT
jgi:GntR family transcriptional regulator of vanillate catabolism